MRSDTCGCCEPSAKPTPVEIQNRPGLSAIAYRVGTFASFRQAMIQAMAESPELDGLRTRESDDYAITILELWAAVADVLTFYQERIASEAFLRTANYRDSVMRLARLLDYQLRPGVAATACLAFTVEKEKKVRIPVGLRIQSVPGQDEKPQKFETLEDITADARWNRLRILPAPVSINPLDNPPGKPNTEAFLIPGSDGLAIAKTLSPGNNIILFNDGKNNPVEILEVKEVCTEGDHIILSWSKPIQGKEWTSKTVVYKTLRQFRLFGYNVPETYMHAEKDPGGRIIAWKEVPLNNNLLKYPNEPMKYPNEPKKQKITTSGTPAETEEYLFLDARYDDLKAGVLLLISDGGGNKVKVTVEAVEQGRDTLGPMSDTVTKVKIYPPLSSIEDRRRVIIYELEGPQISFWEYEYPDEIDMQDPKVYIAGSNIVGETIEIGQSIEAGAYVPGVKIGLKEIEKGRKVLLVDEQQAPVSAAITSSSLTKYGSRSYLMLNLEPVSKMRLKRGSAALLGNIALVSHGETVKPEIAGDGDASAKSQRFSLKKMPVTLVPSAGSGGVENTLNVLVNNVLWREAPSLFGRGATEQVYITKVDDDGTMSIQFGDGTTGARLPSGRGNIIAKYRQGSGLSGRVRANTITTLLDRPVGLKSATNPAPAEGGADQETLDQARTNAPVTVRTFGRAVSLRDFEDLAMTSGEIAKARATWVWSGWKRAVHLTVAGQQGSTFSANALARIHASLTTQRDPNHALFLDNYRPVPVVVTTRLGVADGHVAEEVGKEARTALLEALSFERLEFGRPLHLSEVFAILQGVNGAAWVDVDLFHFKDRSKKNRGADLNPVQEHLRIYPARINPTSPFIVLPAEQACIEAPTVDIQIMTSGGLP